MDIYRNTMKNGGGTFTKDGKAVSFKKGYQVAITDFRIPLHRFSNKFYLLKFVRNLCNGYTQKGIYIGTWNDKKGFISVDVSLYIADKEMAMIFAKEYKQESIFDWKNGTCIDVA